MGEFRLGDLVRTHTGATAPVKVISRQVKLARDVRLRSMLHFPLVATDEHKFWTPRGMVQLSDLNVGDEIGFPIYEIEDGVTSVEFARPAKPRPQGGGSIERVPDVVELNYDVGRILGLYLAEGTVKLQRTSGEYSGVHFSVHENEVDRTIHWLGILAGLITSINVYRHKNSKTVVVTAYGKSFAAFVDKMCGMTDGKHVPIEWRTSGKEFARGLVHGYLCGDGHFTKSGIREIVATSVREAITVGMRDIIAALGYGWSSISFRPGATRYGRNERDAYILTLCGPGSVKLAKECGKQYLPYTRPAAIGNKGSRIDGGYAWMKIASIGELVEQDVMDFEVDHQDHSYCTIQAAASNSEYAFWDNAQMHLAGIGSTVGDVPGTEIILESTANGLGNSFHELWQAAEAGQNEWIPIFLPWFIQPEYRAPVRPDFVLSDDDAKYQQAYGLDLEQMQWRANKIATYGKGFDWLFAQEFPATAAEAFQSATQNPLISPSDVMEAVNSKFKERQGPLVIGCDPAEEGMDRTAIVFRQGRTAFRIEYHERKRPMEVAGILAGYWTEHKPDGLFVDKGGIGSGIVDRLRELGIPVIAVNFGERATDTELYENKRAECWWRMKEWVEDHPNRLPNDAAMIADLIAPQPMVTSKSKRLLESKKDMRKRGIRSPDGGDALAVTFAEPVNQMSNLLAGRSAPAAPTTAGY